VFPPQPVPPDPGSEALPEVPLPPYVTAEDAQFAVRAVVVHAPEQWPQGTVCRNDKLAYPCRLHRWGRRVLALRGLSDADVEALIAAGDPHAPTPPPDRPVTGEVTRPHHDPSAARNGNEWLSQWQDWHARCRAGQPQRPFYNNRGPR
jgi:hypothetical protein